MLEPALVLGAVMGWESLGHSLKGPPGLTLLPVTLQVQAPLEGRRLPILRAPVALRLRRVDLVLQGSTPSLTCNLRMGSDVSAAGAELVAGGFSATSTTTGQTLSNFPVDVLPAEAWLWLETSGGTGTITLLHLVAYLEPVVGA